MLLYQYNWKCGEMNKHEYICKITEVVASKSTCNRAIVGAVFVNEDFEVRATGYNGAPRGFKDCGEIGHLIENEHCVRTIHAEQNAIIQAAKNGTRLQGTILYSTYSPCYTCAKMIANLRIRKVMFKKLYTSGGGKEALKLLKEAGITIEFWSTSNLSPNNFN